MPSVTERDVHTAHTTISTPSYGGFFIIVESRYENSEWRSFSSTRPSDVQDGDAPVDHAAIRAFYGQPLNGFGNAFRVRLDAVLQQ